MMMKIMKKTNVPISNTVAIIHIYSAVSILSNPLSRSFSVSAIRHSNEAIAPSTVPIGLKIGMRIRLQIKIGNWPLILGGAVGLDWA